MLSVPHGLRFRMAFDPMTTSLVLRIFVRAVGEGSATHFAVVGI